MGQSARYPCYAGTSRGGHLMPVARTSRRALIAALGGAAAWPLVARARQQRKIPVVGILWHAGNEEEEANYLGALRKGLKDLGYLEGQSIILANRFAAENYDRFSS